MTRLTTQQDQLEAQLAERFKSFDQTTDSNQRERDLREIEILTNQKGISLSLESKRFLEKECQQTQEVTKKAVGLVRRNITSWTHWATAGATGVAGIAAACTGVDQKVVQALPHVTKAFQDLWNTSMQGERVSLEFDQKRFEQAQETLRTQQNQIRQNLTQTVDKGASANRDTHEAISMMLR